VIHAAIAEVDPDVAVRVIDDHTAQAAEAGFFCLEQLRDHGLPVGRRGGGNAYGDEQ
jgi:hypothetical protein